MRNSDTLRVGHILTPSVVGRSVVSPTSPRTSDLGPKLPLVLLVGGRGNGALRLVESILLVAQAQTPLDRLAAFYANKPLPKVVGALCGERDRTDPFRLSETIDKAMAALARKSEKAKKNKYTVLAQNFPSPRGGEHNPERPQPSLHG